MAPSPRLPLVVALLGLTLLLAPTQHGRAVTPPLVQDHDLVYVYLATTYERTSEVCGYRFRDLAGSLDSALKAWKARHVEALSEMRRLHDELHSASQASPAINGLLATDRLAQLARMSTDDELFRLAASLDAQARPFCEKRRAELNDDDRTRVLFLKARDAARDLLERKRADTEEYQRRQRPSPR